MSTTSTSTGCLCVCIIEKWETRGTTSSSEGEREDLMAPPLAVNGREKILARKEARTTRSGREPSQPNKMKRDEDTAVSSASKKKMTSPDEAFNVQIGGLKAFLSDKLGESLKINREEIANDNKLSLEAVAGKVNQTQNDLNNHKKMIGEGVRKMKENIEDISARLLNEPGGASSYAAVSSVPQTTGRGSSPEMRQYWRARCCARIWTVEGDCTDGL